MLATSEDKLTDLRDKIREKDQSDLFNQILKNVSRFVNKFAFSFQRLSCL